jgi:hypothetical protein
MEVPGFAGDDSSAAGLMRNSALGMSSPRQAPIERKRRRDVLGGGSLVIQRLMQKVWIKQAKKVLVYPIRRRS